MSDSPNRTYYSHEAEMQARRDQTIGALVFMLLGATLGAVLAMLFTPREGEEYRQIIRSKVNEALDEGYNRGRKVTQDALNTLEKEYPNIGERVNNILNRTERNGTEQQYSGTMRY